MEDFNTINCKKRTSDYNTEKASASSNFSGFIRKLSKNLNHFLKPGSKIMIPNPNNNLIFKEKLGKIEKSTHK